MFSLFNKLIGKETNLTTNLVFDDPSGNSVFIPLSFSSDFNDCSDTYEAIKAEIETVQKDSLKLKIIFEIKIKLNGKLNGNNLSQEFNDLESYRYFLEQNYLIKQNGNSNNDIAGKYSLSSCKLL